ncbi:MAG: SLC13 family permease [Pseudomonadota bacterium]|nr:SLC13 family permease [Pseudomonadota bacterium]
MTYRTILGICCFIAVYYICSPAMLLLLLISGTLASWFTWPKQSLRTSIACCFLITLYGLVPVKEAFAITISHPVVLLVVGCALAKLIVKNDIHLAISQTLVTQFRPKTELSLVILMLFVSSFLSMWISNTSVVAMLIPVTMSLSESLQIPCVRLLISIAYGATIGGMLTPIGTPANLVAVAYAQRYFNLQIDFMMWFSYALPFVSLLLCFVCLYFWYATSKRQLTITQSSYQISPAQKRLMIALSTCIILWATQTAPFGGWARMLGVSIQEEWIGLFILALCSQVEYNKRRAFTLSDLATLPFSSIAMVVAGIFIAEGMMQQGVVVKAMNYFIQGQWLYNYQALALFGFVMSSITELCSNTAVASLGLPLSEVMMRLSHLEVIPCIFLITLSAHSAVMLPTATPPNALVLGTGKVTAKQLISVGLITSVASLGILVFIL